MARSDTAAAPLTRPDGTPIRVLAVDDETSLTELLSMAMRYEGWQVTTASSGSTAVKAAREVRPDAIVLDMMLPDFDGLEVMRRIRTEDPDVPVIFLTAKDAVEDRIGGLTAGGDDYVTKPFSLEEVIARLRALLRRSGASSTRSARAISTIWRSTNDSSLTVVRAFSGTMANTRCSSPVRDSLCILPRAAKHRPAAKSIRRIAVGLSTLDRSMTTASPSRNGSPISFASL